MAQRFTFLVAAVLFCGSAPAADKGGVVEGDIKKLDAGAKTAVVKTADGAEHTIHFVKRTAVHGADDTAEGAKDAFHGLKEGSHVAVRYTAKGTEKTGEEIDHIGRGGLKTTEATFSHVDHGAKTVAVKTADGAEETYHLSDSAAKEIGKGTKKAVKGTVYYTEEGGRKVVHFFKKGM